jgi:hypothetical protein
MHTLRRVSARVVFVFLVSCSSTQVKACGEIVAISCGGCGLLSAEEVQDARELRDRLARCGRCEPGMHCNLVAHTPHCTTDPGEEGAPCGTWTSHNAVKHLTFTCQGSLVCNAAYDPATCTKIGGLRDPCAVDADCLKGLVCSDPVIAANGGDAGPAPRHCRPPP